MFRDMVYIMSFSIQLDIDDFIFLKCLLFLAFSIHTKVPCNFFFVIVLFGLFFFGKKFHSFFSCLCAVGVCINVHEQSVGDVGCACEPPKTKVSETTPSCFFYLIHCGRAFQWNPELTDMKHLVCKRFGRLYLIHPKPGITDWSPHPQGICLDHNSNSHTCLAIILSAKQPFGPSFFFLWT